MARLRGGPLEHLKHYEGAARRVDKEMADVTQAATCRRRFEALLRASEAQGEEQEEWSYLPDPEQLDRSSDTDGDAYRVFDEWGEFIEKCGR